MYFEYDVPAYFWNSCENEFFGILYFASRNTRERLGSRYSFCSTMSWLMRSNQLRSMRSFDCARTSAGSSGSAGSGAGSGSCVS